MFASPVNPQKSVTTFTLTPEEKSLLDQNTDPRASSISVLFEVHQEQVKNKLSVGAKATLQKIREMFDCPPSENFMTFVTTHSPTLVPLAKELVNREKNWIDNHR